MPMSTVYFSETSATTSITATPYVNAEKDYYIYNSNGEFIGIDYKNMYAQNPEMAEFVDKNISKSVTSQDSFVRAVAKTEEEYNNTQTAKKDNKTKLSSLIDLHTDTMAIDAYSATRTKEASELNVQIARLKIQQIDLTKSDSSAPVVIEASRHFQSKLRRLESDIVEFSKEVKNEKEENDKIVYEPNYFDNNPFIASAIETTDYEDEYEMQNK